MQAFDIVMEIARALELQTTALAADDFERFDELIDVTGMLSAELEQAAARLEPVERAAVAEQLRQVVEQASRLCGDTELRREETREEIRELRNGHSVMTAYRQALPREAALSYSRQG